MAIIKNNIFRFYFYGCTSITESFSQAGQDLFVLSALNGKRNGTYLEIGSGPAQSGSNTFLLEYSFDWTGIGIEFDEGFCRNQRKWRKTFTENADATQVDYLDLFRRANHNSNTFDYLSLDLDGDATLQTLYKLPLKTHKFATVTYEHDYYVYETLNVKENEKYRRLSRECFLDYGYQLVLPDVASDELYNSYLPNGSKIAGQLLSFEDWWVHPELVDMDRVKFMIRKNENKNLWSDYIFVN